MFLNRELVRRGLAWHYKEYSDDKRLADDENSARSKKLGLWGGDERSSISIHPTSPLGCIRWFVVGASHPQLRMGFGPRTIL